MEKAKIVLCDTDVIIEFYKNNPIVIEKLKGIGQQNIAISIITAGELIYGALNKRELTQINKDINSLIIKEIDLKICDHFLLLLNKYGLSHKLSLPDGFIAATALAFDITLYTLNEKDFRFIDGLKLYPR